MDKIKFAFIEKNMIKHKCHLTEKYFSKFRPQVFYNWSNDIIKTNKFVEFKVEYWN